MEERISNLSNDCCVCGTQYARIHSGWLRAPQTLLRTTTRQNGLVILFCTLLVQIRKGQIRFSYAAPAHLDALAVSFPQSAPVALAGLPHGRFANSVWQRFGKPRRDATPKHFRRRRPPANVGGVRIPPGNRGGP